MKKTAIVFPGLGSQCVGMGKTLCKEYTLAREVYEEAGDILNMDLKGICSEGTIGKIFDPDIAQLALFTTGIALYKVFKSIYNIEPLLMAGHSLGEYTALAAAGIIKFEDALNVIKLRSCLTKEVIMQDFGSMAIIDGISFEKAEAYCRERSQGSHYAVISCYNAPEQVALSGCKDVMQNVQDKIMECSTAIITPIYGSAPFHSELMRPMAEKLNIKLNNITYYDSDTTVLSNLTGLPYRDRNEVSELLSEQLCRPVQWMRIMDYMKAKNLDFVIEMSSLSVLRNLIRAYCHIETYSFGQIETRRNLEKILDRLNSGIGQKEDLKRAVYLCFGMAVSTKNKEYDSIRYQEKVRKPYECLKELYLKNAPEDYITKQHEACQAIELLREILNGKQVGLDEQYNIFKHIYNVSGTSNILGGRYL